MCLSSKILLPRLLRRGIMISQEEDFSQNLLAKAIYRFDFSPPAKAGGN
jgi:hypothetical protein